MVEKIEHGKAVAALVLGIISCVLAFTGVGAVGGVILGIVGIILAVKAKKAGNVEGIRTAGFVLSIIGLCVCGVAVVLTLGLLGLAASCSVM